GLILGTTHGAGMLRAGANPRSRRVFDMRPRAALLATIGSRSGKGTRKKKVLHWPKRGSRVGAAGLEDIPYPYGEQRDRTILSVEVVVAVCGHGVGYWLLFVLSTRPIPSIA